VPPFRLSCLRNFAEIILENGGRSWKNPGKTLEFYVMKRVGTLFIIYVGFQYNKDYLYKEIEWNICL